jgi:two-component system NarL family response regulator
MPDPRLSILCIDDNDLLAGALERWIEGNPEFRWAGWMPEPSGLKDLTPGACPDLVLMDLDIPTHDTVAALQEALAVCPLLRVIVLSGHINAHEIQAMLAAGARGYLTKDQSVLEILDCARRVIAGEVVLSREARIALASAGLVVRPRDRRVEPSA